MPYFLGGANQSHHSQIDNKKSYLCQIPSNMKVFMIHYQTNATFHSRIKRFISS